VAAIVYFLVHTRRQQSAEFWVMGGLLCAVIASIALELAYQDALLPPLGISMAHFVLPALFCFIAFRLIQVYAQALQAAERSRTELEQRVREITAEVEHSVNQMAQARIEKIAEKERKRIASDLHDDLGAKLLTIIHTSDSDRISNLAREALEEMRLSVRGLTGRPVQLADAMADWRSETVSRLGETSIRVDWKSPADIPPLALSARTYVQTTRILREAVSNIIKHSGSSHCDIAALINRTDFQIIIHDNGRGIPMQLDGKLDRGHGMSSMKSRAKQLQGQCLVESGPNLGTIIRLTLPLEIPPTNEPIAATMSRLTSKAGPHEANPPA
jgi:signal transduction histidine kinase